MFLSLSEGVLVMKTAYIIGVLLFLLVSVGSASAETEFHLTKVNDPTYNGIIDIKVVYNGDTITVTDVSPDLDTVSNVDIKAIGIVNPSDNKVTSVIDTSSKHSIWTLPKPNEKESFNRAGFGSFSTIYVSRDSIKTRGPIEIKLDKSFDTLPVNDNGYSIAAHISFGDEDNPEDLIVGSTWVGGTSQIPEFPTMALPVAAILGLMFIFGRRRKE